MPPTPLAVPDGSRIRELCEQLGLTTTTAIADRAGRHRTTIGNVLHSKPVSLRVLGDVADFLDTETEHLLDPDQSAVADPP